MPNKEMMCNLDVAQLEKNHTHNAHALNQIMTENNYYGRS